jgi:hypothetical protein
MTQLSSQRERLARPLTALLDLTQLDEPAGEIGQGGTAMLLERRVERVEGPSLAISCAQSVGGDAYLIQRQARRRLPV